MMTETAIDNCERCRNTIRAEAFEQAAKLAEEHASEVRRVASSLREIKDYRRARQLDSEFSGLKAIATAIRALATTPEDQAR